MFLRLCPLLFATTLVTAADPVRFNRDVRPILSDKCFFCHGPDANERKAGLRLDERESATRAAKSGVIAVVPGKPEQSELINRISLAHDDDDFMPPKKSAKTISAAEVDTLRRWIKEGAHYEGHWAFAAPARPDVEAARKTLKDTSLTHPVDVFVAQKAEAQGLALSPEADPATLIRRLTLDLTGLPPTDEEVRAFESGIRNQQSGIFETTVDRLLNSTHFGEMMAHAWLDNARYADSHGFQTDSSRQQWPWRDWVIGAFNRNLPFDQFTVQQLAGDLLPNPTRDQLVATGFNRNHRLNGEGGIIDEEWRIENVIDRTETMGTTWMALSLNCCRCHDHKFDPITQREFYQFFAFFNNNTESGTIRGSDNRRGGNAMPLVSVPSAEQEKQQQALVARIAEAESAVKAQAKDLPALVAAWMPKAKDSLAGAASPWTVLEPASLRSLSNTKLVKQSDGSFLATGNNPANDTYVFDAPMPEAGTTALLLECLTDPSLPGGGPGRNSNSNFALSAFEVFLQLPGGKPIAQTISRAEADHSQKGYDIKNVIGRRRAGSWAVDGPTRKEPRKALFVLEKPVPATKGAMLMLRLRHETISQHNIGRFRLSASALPAAPLSLKKQGPDPKLIAALDTPVARQNAAQKKLITDYFRANIDSPVKQADAKLAALRTERDKLELAMPSVMVLEESAKPRDAFVLNRGEYDKPGDKVTAALPKALPAMAKGEPMNRLGLARWLVNGEHPLTARVWVNRQWERLFGRGIVKSVENFGMQAEYPSHPELLDYLATEFVRSGWDMKAMLKHIVMSRTYRQSAVITADAQRIDPENRLLSHAPRVRLSGEVVRDQALALSGLLVPTIGGPSVRPYMPEGVWDETSKYGDLRGYKADTGPGLYRRSLYTIWKRTAAPPTMLLFDSPTREICTVKRSRTNTPLQALALLNEVTFVEAAKVLAQRMIRDGGPTPESRIAWAFRHVTARDPKSSELAVLTTGLSKRLSHYTAEPTAAAALQATPELAAYTLTANVLLNLDEVVTRP